MNVMQRWVLLTGLVTALAASLVALLVISAYVVLHERYERSRFDPIVALDVASLPPELPPEIAAYLPRSAGNLVGAYDVESQEYRTRFSYAADDPDLSKYEAVPSDRLREIHFGVHASFPWWPESLEGIPSETDLKRDGLDVSWPQARVTFGPEGRVLLATDPLHRVGYLYVYYH